MADRRHDHSPVDQLMERAVAPRRSRVSEVFGFMTDADSRSSRRPTVEEAEQTGAIRTHWCHLTISPVDDAPSQSLSCQGGGNVLRSQRTHRIKASTSLTLLASTNTDTTTTHFAVACLLTDCVRQFSYNRRRYQATAAAISCCVWAQVQDALCLWYDSVLSCSVMSFDVCHLLYDRRFV